MRQQLKAHEIISMLNLLLFLSVSASEKTRYLAIDTSAKLQRLVDKERNEKIGYQQKFTELQVGISQFRMVNIVNKTSTVSNHCFMKRQ